MFVCVNSKGIAFGLFFSLDIAFNIRKKEFVIPKTIAVGKKWKIWNICVLSF